MAAVEVNGLDEFLTKVSDLPKQMAFATSQALNDTAKEIQQYTVNTLLPEKFTLRARGNPWQTPGTKLGFNIQFASKTNLESRIGSQADFLANQEFGGIKERSYDLSIPTTSWKPKADLMVKARKPKALLSGKLRINGNRAFVATLPNGVKGIFVRKGPGRLPLQLLFTSKATATIHKRLDFIPRGTEIANQRFEENFTKRFNAAVLTAR